MSGVLSRGSARDASRRARGVGVAVVGLVAALALAPTAWAGEGDVETGLWTVPGGGWADHEFVVAPETVGMVGDGDCVLSMVVSGVTGTLSLGGYYNGSGYGSGVDIVDGLNEFVVEGLENGNTCGFWVNDGTVNDGGSFVVESGSVSWPDYVPPPDPTPATVVLSADDRAALEGVRDTVAYTGLVTVALLAGVLVVAGLRR